jgi:hypothetical protein
MNIDVSYTPFANSNGTSLQGYMTTCYDDIVKVLGEPHYRDEDKVTCEWSIQFNDGPVATLYDWKEYKTPMGKYEWHIGGETKSAVMYMRKLFQSAGINVNTKTGW